MAVSDTAGALTAPPRGARIGATAVAGWRDYVTLTKPRIMSLLVLTAVCAMVAAAGGDPALLPLAALVVGGGLSCGGASALNHVLDRDIDRLMGPRTASRPVAAGRISPARATAFGLVLLGSRSRCWPCSPTCWQRCSRSAAAPSTCSCTRSG